VICENKGYQFNHRIGYKWCNSVKQAERVKQSQNAEGRITTGKSREATKKEKEETTKMEEVDMECQNE